MKRTIKNILIFSSTSLYPVEGMSQVRLINQIKSLSTKHSTSLMYFYTKEEQKIKTATELNKYCSFIIPIKTFTQSILFRAIKKVALNKAFKILSQPLDYYTNSNLLSAHSIANKIMKSNYNVVITHYWQASGFMKMLPENIYKAIDTHYLVEENIKLFKKGMYSHIKNRTLGKLLNKELEIQNNCFKYVDLLIVNSRQQKDILDSKGIKKSIVVPNGQDIEKYLNVTLNPCNNDINILFYGSLSNQFNQRAVKRLLEKIWPSIKNLYPSIKLIIMGSGPTEWIINKSKEDENIEVTGYVENVNEIFKVSTVAVIPLESGSGFRGRVVELMAGGVPVIGTNNALKSINISNMINGIVADRDEDIIKSIIEIVNNNQLRTKISNEGRKFVKENYTIESTFDVLGDYLLKV